MLLVLDKRHFTLSTSAQHSDRPFTLFTPKVMASTHKEEELKPQFDLSPGYTFLDQPACASQEDNSKTLSPLPKKTLNPIKKTTNQAHFWETLGEYKKWPIFPHGKLQFDVLIFIVRLSSN